MSYRLNERASNCDLKPVLHLSAITNPGVDLGQDMFFYIYRKPLCWEIQIM